MRPIHLATLDKARPVLIGFLLPAQEAALAYAIVAAYGLDL